MLRFKIFWRKIKDCPLDSLLKDAIQQKPAYSALISAHGAVNRFVYALSHDIHHNGVATIVPLLVTDIS